MLLITRHVSKLKGKVKGDYMQDTGEQTWDEALETQVPL